MSLCDNCIQGVRHEGEPEGEIEVINGVKTYVAKPTREYAKDKAVLLLPDVFGIELINARLLADDFARNGFQVYAVDYLNEDSLPQNALDVSDTLDLCVIDLSFVLRGKPGSNVNTMEWLGKHSSEATRAPLNKVIDGLKEKGVTKFAATGYCFGGRYVFDLAFDKVIKVAVVSHPSLLQVPKDLERFKESGIPLLINSCEEDSQFPISSQALADKILGDGKTSSELYVRKYFEGCAHGFAVRGDLSIPKVKAGKEGAFESAVKFFLKHL